MIKKQLQKEKHLMKVVVVGGGPAGMMAAITAAKERKWSLPIRKKC